MNFPLKKTLKICSIILILIVVITILIHKFNLSKITMAANIHPKLCLEKNTYNNNSENTDLEYSERFQRPSKDKLLKLKYTFNPPDKNDDPFIPKGYPKIYASSDDLIQAYFSIIGAASNMEGFYGGCGTINWHSTPYPYAYELLSDSFKKSLSLEKFKESFKGIGQVNLLKLIPAYTPEGTPENIEYYFVETEIISGESKKLNFSKKAHPTYFSYYYGLITTEYNKEDGWKIKSMDYIPEDFLCAPMHGWSWDSKLLTETIYKDWYGIIDEVYKINKTDNIIYLYGKQKDKEYKFMFVRLTNGVDILLKEYVKEKDEWIETNILKDKDQYFKFSILNPILKQ